VAAQLYDCLTMPKLAKSVKTVPVVGKTGKTGKTGKIGKIGKFKIDKFLAIEIVVELLDVAAYTLAFYAIASTPVKVLLNDVSQQDAKPSPDTVLLNKETDILVDSTNQSRTMAIIAMVLVCIAFILRTIVKRLM
jgi:hypothetical protein